jgi:hypothetical protein
MLESSRCTSNATNTIDGASIDEAKDKSFAMNLTNTFLNYFFDELENGIDQVLKSSAGAFPEA